MSEENVNAHAESQKSRGETWNAILKILPVRLYGPSGMVETYALLDDASSITMVEKELAMKLGLRGHKKPLSLAWTADVSRNEADSEEVNLEISKCEDGGKRFKLMRARTVGELKLKPQTINLPKIAEEWPFVKRGDVASMENAVPRVIIGQDNWPLIFPRKSFYGPRNGPVISMTWLGWVLYGKLPQKLTRNERVTSHIHFAHWEDVRDEKEDRDSEFADENCAEINECFDKGNARVLSTEEADRVMETIPSELTAKSCSKWCQCENVEVLDGDMTDHSFIYSRAPVAPVKRISTPQLELQAVVMAAQTGTILTEELGLDIPGTTYWTDSTVIFHWVRAHQKKFVHNAYVASRVLDILERSNADEWRWVPTKKNPADFAPRENPKQNLPI
ncbi:hypothetical protein GE061_015912 [Apolygus lucorum]|uniref:Peptidase aspartic putative domain-containing protein n=1 Tax=Apolygus lucorum TaxID=248454 RepID=A0A8S9XHD1_APOLU|nr:hypothetical protein GE061_015912 [Apolygus lucorum]